MTKVSERERKSFEEALNYGRKEMRTKEKKLFTKTELAKFGEVCRDEALMNKGIFTTSMNRKVCWEDGFKQGKKQFNDDIILARQCLIFGGRCCNNEDCKNKQCPLNKFWEIK